MYPELALLDLSDPLVLIIGLFLDLVHEAGELRLVRRYRLHLLLQRSQVEEPQLFILRKIDGQTSSSSSVRHSGYTSEMLESGGKKNICNNTIYKQQKYTRIIQVGGIANRKLAGSNIHRDYSHLYSPRRERERE